MKIYISSKMQRCRGGAMILAVLFLVLVASLLATYLFITQGEYNSVARSQTWNASMALAEAGVEDALAFINQNAGNINAVTNWTGNASSVGWARIVNNSTTQVFYLTNRTPDVNLGYYSVYVTNDLTSSTNGPSILSIGTAYWVNNANPHVGDSNIIVSYQGNAVRKVFVHTVPGSQLVGGGVIALSTMDFKGNNVTIDSFDSTDPQHSLWQTNWLYHGAYYGTWNSSLSFNTNTPPSRTANVIVATDGAILNVGNANIAGYVDTAPGGLASVGANGLVGDLNWVFGGGGSGIQPGHSRDDMNKTFFSLQLPIPTNGAQTNWLSVPAVSTNIGGVTYSYIITNKAANSNRVYYSMNSLGSSLYINASNVVLYLVNGMNYSSSDTLTLNTNADVQLWSTGDISTSGNAVINNQTLNTHAFSIYDVSGYPINITLAGNGAGTGYIYTPSASLTFSGGGSSSYDVVGAIFCHDIKINGHYNFHFDESLQYTLPSDQYTSTTWQEVP